MKNVFQHSKQVLSVTALLCTSIFVNAQQNTELPEAIDKTSSPDAIQSTHSDELYFDATLGNKISLYGNRLSSTSMYGFGVGNATLYSNSANYHAFMIGKRVGPTWSATTIKQYSTLWFNTRELIFDGPDAVMTIKDNNNNSVNAARLVLEEDNGEGGFILWNGSEDRMFFGTNNNNIMVLGTDNVGIGTRNLDGVNADYRLAVNGKIRSKEIVVELSDWPDYVFADDYKLKPLNEVESFIKENNHLPEIPSATEVVESGVAVGEMQHQLLRKVEELTLYMIELNKSLEEVKAENAALKAELSR